MTANWLKDLNLKPRSNSVKTFKSYVDLESDSTQQSSIVNEFDEDTDLEEKILENLEEQPPYPTPTLLPGEVTIAQADNVLKFNTLSEYNKGISGTLLCTNFKLSFVTAESFSSNLHQKSLILGENDICLMNVDAVFHVVNGKRKKLTLSNITTNIEIVEVHCKNLKIYTYSFKFSPVNQRSVINSLIHHAFPPKISLLFAFDYREHSIYSEESESHSLLFTRPCDWEAEIERCKCPGWRVTQANEKFLLCESLPESFVVPSILLDMNLNKSAPHFAGHRVPVWTWGVASGASIIRMAALDPSISDSRQKDVMVDAVSRASPRQLPVHIFDLDETCPSYKEVQSSFLKLKDLCTSSTANEFWETDSNYLGLLDATRWFHHLSSCLSIAVEAAKMVSNNTTVIFSEHEGRDLSCVLSSLVQLILDPFYHTTNGFQILIQKEWIALGHPFTERHRLTSSVDSEESAIFLLFLDCVWQLSQQCPTVFEFSETYLTSLWDSCFISVFDSFMFSSHKSRSEALLAHDPNRHFSLRSVWNWSRQFSRNDRRLFSNPLYILNNYISVAPNRPLSKTQRPRSLSCLKDTTQSLCRPLFVRKDVVEPIFLEEDEENLLKIDPYIKSLKLWHQCYLRWIPLAHVVGGGLPVLFLTNLKIADEIQALEKEISVLTSKSKKSNTSLRHRRAASDDYTISADIIDSSNIQEGSSIITSVFPFSPVAPWDWSSYHFVPSTSCLKISYTDSEVNDE